MAQPPSQNRKYEIFVVSPEHQDRHEPSSNSSTDSNVDSVFDVTLTTRQSGESVEELYRGNASHVQNNLTNLVDLLHARVAAEITDRYPVCSIQIIRNDDSQLLIHGWDFALIDSEEDMPTNYSGIIYPQPDFVICLTGLSKRSKDESILRHAILKLLMAQKTLKLLDLTLLQGQLTENEWEDIIGPQIECLPRIRLGDDYAGNLMTVYARAPVFRCLILDFSVRTVRLGLSVNLK